MLIPCKQIAWIIHLSLVCPRDQIYQNLLNCGGCVGSHTLSNPYLDTHNSFIPLTKKQLRKQDSQSKDIAEMVLWKPVVLKLQQHPILLSGLTGVGSVSFPYLIRFPWEFLCSKSFLNLILTNVVNFPHMSPEWSNQHLHDIMKSECSFNAYIKPPCFQCMCR